MSGNAWILATAVGLPAMAAPVELFAAKGIGIAATGTKSGNKADVFAKNYKYANATLDAEGKDAIRNAPDNDPTLKQFDRSGGRQIGLQQCCRCQTGKDRQVRHMDLVK